MELNEYQKRAMSTCMPTCSNFGYMMLNLVGEVGEFSSKVAKAIRKDQVNVSDGSLRWNYTQEESEDIYKAPKEFDSELRKEAGDILWQLSGLCRVMGWNLEDIAQMNLEKLASRQERGVIDGNGDNR